MKRRCISNTLGPPPPLILNAPTRQPAPFMRAISHAIVKRLQAKSDDLCRRATQQLATRKTAGKSDKDEYVSKRPIAHRIPTVVIVQNAVVILN